MQDVNPAFFLHLEKKTRLGSTSDTGIPSFFKTLKPCEKY
jgi:hypothetical protein